MVGLAATHYGSTVRPVITKCNKLKTIAFSIVYCAPALNRLVSFLESLPLTSKLMIIRFIALPDNTVEPPTKAEWESLDQLLQKPQLASVATLLIYREILAARARPRIGVVSGDRGMNFAELREQLIQLEGMPLSYRRGILYSRITGPCGNQVVKL